MYFSATRRDSDLTSPLPVRASSLRVPIVQAWTTQSPESTGSVLQQPGRSLSVLCQCYEPVECHDIPIDGSLVLFVELARHMFEVYHVRGNQVGETDDGEISVQTRVAADGKRQHVDRDVILLGNRNQLFDLLCHYLRTADRAQRH